jgi:hypothetical protein
LYPFQVEQERGCAADIKLTGALVRSITGLQIQYELSGNLDHLFLPAPSTTPARKDGLWQTTCFELFVAASGSSRYWEINLSPAGDWNVYVFTDYRQGMEEEAVITALPFTQFRNANRYQLTLDFPLADIIAPDKPVELALSAVLEINGQRAFYALTHCGPQPDFHNRESFLVQL